MKTLDTHAQKLLDVFRDAFASEAFRKQFEATSIDRLREDFQISNFSSPAFRAIITRELFIEDLSASTPSQLQSLLHQNGDTLNVPKSGDSEADEHLSWISLLGSTEEIEYIEKLLDTAESLNDYASRYGCSDAVVHSVQQSVCQPLHSLMGTSQERQLELTDDERHRLEVFGKNPAWFNLTEQDLTQAFGIRRPVIQKPLLLKYADVIFGAYESMDRQFRQLFEHNGVESSKVLIEPFIARYFPQIEEAGIRLTLKLKNRIVSVLDTPGNMLDRSIRTQLNTTIEISALSEMLSIDLMTGKQILPTKKVNSTRI